MTHKIGVQSYSQNGQKFINFIIDFKRLNQVSEVLIYGECKYGYQRKADKKHVTRIKNYLLEENNAILSSSIIVGVDSKSISQILSKDGEQSYIDLKSLKKPIFRIIDGQHRLQGLEEAAKENPNFNRFMFNVVAIVTNVEERYKELDVFTDINSKNKRIHVDLALLAKYNYQIYGGKIENLGEHVAVKTAYKLKENRSERNIWLNGINFDVYEENALGIVSVNAFVQSIMPMCNRYLRDIDFQVETATDEAKYAVVEQASDYLSSLLLEAWIIVEEKWGGCFTAAVEHDYFNEIKEYFYNRKYYIQKALGVKVINAILYDSIRRKSLKDYNIGKFYRTIIASNVNRSNWSTGDIFAGLSSESGFKLAKSYILNKKSED